MRLGKGGKGAGRSGIGELPEIPGRKAFLVLLGLALLHNWIWPPPGRCEKEVRQAFERIMELWVDREFGEVWERLSSRRRAQYASGLENRKRLAWNDPEWGRLERSCGLHRWEVMAFEPKDWYLARLARPGPLEEFDYANTVDIIEGLEVLKVRMAGERAFLEGNSLEEVGTLLAVLVLEDGEWQMEGAVWHDPRFQRLQRKLSFHLPRGPVGPEGIVALVRVGPGELTEADLKRIREFAENLTATGERGRVVLDVSPEVVWQDMIHIVDQFYAGDFVDLLLTREPDAPIGPGIQVNGLPIEEVLSGSVPPLPVDDSALDRILHAGR